MGGSLRVAVLGAPGVGKTAIIRQFLFGDYPERHRPTDGPRLYRPAVLLDGAVYDLSIRDGDGARPGQNPGGPEEWPDPKDWSLQDTDAFVLVYDICSPDSFDYVKALRQRISETRWGRGHRCVWAAEGSFCHSGWAFAQGERVGSSPVLAGSRACRLCGLRAIRVWCFLRGVSGHCGGKVSRAVGCPARQPSSPSGPQAGGRTRGSHPRGRQQAGPAAAALRASARAGRPGAPGLALRLPRVLRQVQLARAASFPRAAALRFGARAPCASGPAPAGGAAPRALQPHVTELDYDADGWGVGGWFDWNNRVPGLDEIAQLLSDWTGQSLLPDWMRKPPTQFPRRQDSL